MVHFILFYFMVRSGGRVVAVPRNGGKGGLVEGVVQYARGQFCLVAF